MNSEKMKHTPGPWHRNIRAGGRYPVIFAGRNQYIAVASQQQNPDETEANIDLIAAAPELLEALQDCLESLNRLPDAPDAYRITCIKQARAAIAKALNQAL